jgi:outer membrane protein TolC
LALKAELSATLASFQDSARRMQRYEMTLIPLAEQALDNSRAAYESDQLSALEMIDSERSLLELKLNYWRAAANAHQAVAKINALIGE